MTSPSGPAGPDRSTERPGDRTATGLVGSGWAPTPAAPPPAAPTPADPTPAAAAPREESEPRPAADRPAPPEVPAAPARPPLARPEPAGSTRRPAGEPGSRGDGSPTTVLPGAAGLRRPAPARPAQRSAPARVADGPRPAGPNRRAKLALQRIDPWSVFLYSLVASIFLGVALVVAVAALYAVLSNLGVLQTVNELFLELSGGDAGATPLFTTGRFVGGAAVLAAVNVVLITLLATLGALLYNLCASFTGGIEVTLGDRDA